MLSGRDEYGAPLLNFVQVQAMAVGGQLGRRVIYAAGGSTGAHNKGVYRYRTWLMDPVWEDGGGGQIGRGTSVWALLADPGAPLGIWAGTGIGLYYSANAGGDWVAIRSLPAGPVQALLADGSHLLVRVEGRMFRADLASARRATGVWVESAHASAGEVCKPTLPVVTQVQAVTSQKTVVITATEASTAPAPTSGIIPSPPPPTPASAVVRTGALTAVGKVLAEKLLILLAGALAFGLVVVWLRFRRAQGWRAAVSRAWGFVLGLLPERWADAIEGLASPNLSPESDAPVGEEQTRDESGG
jgi:hypothetical protein